jgi:hypothetical protein
VLSSRPEGHLTHETRSRVVGCAEVGPVRTHKMVEAFRCRPLLHIYEEQNTSRGCKQTRKPSLSRSLGLSFSLSHT